MGKRKKASKPQGPKKAEKLATEFTCLFCNHEKSVSVKINKDAGVGNLNCKVCGQTFQCAINYLSAAIDVYSEWVDAADAVAQEAGETTERGGGSAKALRPANRAPRHRDEDDDMHRYEGEGIVDDDEY